MGVFSGGYVTEVSGLTLSISAGFGYFHAHSTNDELIRLDWPETLLMVTPNSTLYIYFNTSSNLTYDVSIPDTSENILLGRVRTKVKF